MSEAIQYLKTCLAWISGEDDRTMDEANIEPAGLKAAIEAAIKEIELSESINTVNELKLARANERIGELTAQNEYLSREMLTPDVFMRLIEWLREDPVRPASLAFTAGIARQIAYALEDEVVPMIKSARKIKQQPQPLLFDRIDHSRFKTGYDRYEAVRKLNVQQFAELFKRNLAGERFDDMIDAMVKP